MIRYSCDLCKRKLDSKNDLRYVVKMEVYAAFDPASADVTKYVGYLVSRHDAVLKSVGAAQKLYDYVYSYDGFAAKLTAAQANKLAVAKGVVAVLPDRLREVDTSSTPSFLGLDAEDGLWDQLGGVGSAGEGIIIGDIDSGIWPESLSFSDRVDADGAPATGSGTTGRWASSIRPAMTGRMPTFSPGTATRPCESSSTGATARRRHSPRREGR